jgi:hypothetical protein
LSGGNDCLSPVDGAADALSYSELYLQAQLDNAVGGKAEEGGCGLRIPSEEGEKPGAPPRHDGPFARHDRFAAKEETAELNQNPSSRLPRGLFWMASILASRVNGGVA